MELKKILSISGYPGLYKFIAQSANGVIVESLADGRRMNASASSKVSSMGEISIYTDSQDVPLADVLTAIYAHTGGKTAIGPKSDAAELKKFFATVVPDYDRDRVHVSDMKKVVSWFNILVDKGMTEFKLDEPEAKPEAEPEAELEAKPEAKLEAKPEPKLKAKPKPKPGAKAAKDGE